MGRRAATVHAVPEGLSCNFWSFRDCFVIFRLCYCNFNVIFLFICFEVVFCIVDVKEKKRKERENNDRKRDVCVFVNFFNVCY